jgi:hypothetical protein
MITNGSLRRYANFAAIAVPQAGTDHALRGAESVGGRRARDDPITRTKDAAAGGPVDARAVAALHRGGSATIAE